MREDARLDRRSWLRGCVGIVFAARTGWSATLADPVEQIKAKAREARMQPFDVSESAHFRGVGDAPIRYRLEALELCESFATDYFAHFRAKGFKIDWPAEKLPIVILDSVQSYAAFEKAFVDEAVGGHYDVDANWLVTFDFRRNTNIPRGVRAADPRLDNTLALVHETFHLLSYNTGLLNRKDDIPLCLVEGLATYAETWRPGNKGAIGAINVRRRLGLELAQKEGAAWLPVKTLLAKDALLTEEKTEQVAYAESSMLLYRLLKDSARLAQLHAYLEALPKANDPTRRLDLATTCFGDLDILDKEIRKPVVRR